VTAAVECYDVSKWYGQVLGVSDITLRFDGGIVGLLGPNGAGKSTLIKLIAGLLRPSRGRATIHGAAAFDDPEARRRLGYCPEHEGTYEELTAVELVATMAELSGVPRRECRERAERELVGLGLKDAMNRRLRGYSRGMRQRAKLAQALVHGPDVLLLDEPLNGCDPLARAQIIERIQVTAAAGATVIISSHVLHEIEAMTQQVVVLFRGRVLAEGDVHKLRELIDERPLRVRVTCARARDLGREIMAAEHVSRISVERSGLEGDALEIESSAPDRLFDELPLLARKHGIKLRSLTSPDDNLEAVFEYLTTRKGA
jgi:ABC-2 type transport system ATP-binding protein